MNIETKSTCTFKPCLPYLYCDILYSINLAYNGFSLDWFSQSRSVQVHKLFFAKIGLKDMRISNFFLIFAICLKCFCKGEEAKEFIFEADSLAKLIIGSPHASTCTLLFFGVKALFVKVNFVRGFKQSNVCLKCSGVLSIMCF